VTLAQAVLDEANLTDANLTDADLTGADLTGAFWWSPAALAPEGWELDTGSGRLKRASLGAGALRGRLVTDTAGGNAGLRGLAEPWYNDRNDHCSGSCAARRRR